MSIVVKREGDGQVISFVKGADAVMMPRFY